MVIGVAGRVVDAAVVADDQETDDHEEGGDDDDEGGDVLGREGATSR